MIRLKELRLEKEKTQEELAKILGISRQVYSNYENEINEPSLEMLIKIAHYFECSTDYLLGRTDDFGNISFTEEEKALGLNPNQTVVLSDVDRYRLHLLAKAEETFGKAYVDGVLKMIELSIQQGKKN